MPYTARTRNRYRLLVAAATGVTACAAAATTGAIAAVASRSMAADNGQAGQALDTTQRQDRPGQRGPVVWKKRPHRTVLVTRTLAPSAADEAVQLGGGSVTPTPASQATPQSVGSGSSGGSGTSGGSSGGSSGPGPAPSSGS